jgi:uncharacterized protein YaiI (UPF0178 family)
MGGSRITWERVVRRIKLRPWACLKIGVLSLATSAAPEKRSVVANFSTTVLNCTTCAAVDAVGGSDAAVRAVLADVDGDGVVVAVGKGVTLSAVRVDAGAAVLQPATRTRADRTPIRRRSASIMLIPPFFPA